VSPGGKHAARTFHGTVREDAQPGDEVTFADGQLRALDTSSTDGNLSYYLLHSHFIDVDICTRVRYFNLSENTAQVYPVRNYSTLS